MNKKGYCDIGFEDFFMFLMIFALMVFIFVIPQLNNTGLADDFCQSLDFHQSTDREHFCSEYNKWGDCKKSSKIYEVNN